MEQTFNIPTQSANEVRKRLVKLQKRAEKMGIKAFTFQFGLEVKVHRFETTAENGDRFVGHYNYYELTVVQDITVHEGWTPIAKLDIEGKEIRSYSTYNSQLEKIGEERMWSKKCDHCGHKKIVHTAFILQNGEEFMKVGKGCMKELAPANAVNIAREFDIYALWSGYLKDMADQFEEGMSGGGRGGFGHGIHVDQVYDKSLLILAMRIGLEQTVGWITSEYGERGDVINKGNRTFDHISYALTLNSQSKRNPDLLHSPGQSGASILPDADYVSLINNQVALFIEKYSDKVAPEKLVEIKAFHEATKARLLDVFLIKTVQGTIEREERNKLNGHYLSDKQRVELEIKQVASSGYESMYGYVSIRTYLTKEGYVVKYIGSSPPNFDGEWAKVKGTVKHTEYKGAKETHLQRMKLI